MRTVRSVLLAASASLALVAAPVAAAPALAAPPGAAGAGVPTAVARATSYAGTVAAGRAAASAALEATKASSISLALVDNGKVVWRQSFGAVDTRGTLPSPTTVYGIGSVSKMLATVAVMQLVDAGRVSLDDPVTTYVTDFTMADPAYRQITVRMLLNHSAGLPGTDYANGMSYEPYSGYEDQVLRTLRTSRLKTTPGSMSVYCNDCFTLAGILVGRVSGMPFTSYVAQHVLAPLDMRHSGYVTALPPRDTYAPVLAADGSGPQPLEITNIYASGGAYSTPSDMAHLATMFMSGGVYQGRRVLSAAAVTQMGSSQIRTTLDPTGGRWFRYGLGWDTVADGGMAAVGVNTWVKGGDTSDYHSTFMVAPKAKLAVTVVGAGSFSSGAAEALGQEILLHALVDQRRLAAMPKKLGAATLPAVRPSDAQLAAIRGTYFGSPAFEHRVVVNPDRTVSLASAVDGAWVTAPTRFSLRTDGRFWTTGSATNPGKALSVASGWGRTFLVLTSPFDYGHYVEDIVVGQRLTSAGPTSEAWQQRLGRTWLLVSEIPSSTAWASPAMAPAAIPGLPGFALLEPLGMLVDLGVSDDVGVMTLVVPTMFGRDQDDVHVVATEGEEWLRVGSMRFRPKDGVAALGSGSTAVTVGADGLAEWRSVPQPGSVSVRGASHWKLYDAELTPITSGSGDGTATAPAGALLVVFGAAGNVVDVTTG